MVSGLMTNELGDLDACAATLVTLDDLPRSSPPVLSISSFEASKVFAFRLVANDATYPLILGCASVGLNDSHNELEKSGIGVFGCNSCTDRGKGGSGLFRISARVCVSCSDLKTWDILEGTLGAIICSTVWSVLERRARAVNREENYVTAP